MSHTSGSGEDTDDGGDEQEASSFTAESIEDALASFREQWQRELEISPKRDPPKSQAHKAPKIDVPNDEAAIEIRARQLFLQGVKHEQNRKFYEAIQFYKRAVQLVPDIEFRLYESTKPKARDVDDNSKRLDNSRYSKKDNRENHADVYEGESDLYSKLTKIFSSNQYVCFPAFDQSTTHISALPMEIVLYILKWVVSSELDIKSLEMFSRVCRGFYISARDSEIWRLACVRVWGVNCGSHSPKFPSWREMYLNRPRLRFNGCYISKTSYIREGENSYQDRCYRPWHLVEYFRYLRFFPEGKVLMLTSTDEPQTCVNSLKHRMPRNTEVLIGHYRLHKKCVSMVLKKQEVKGGHNTYRRMNRREYVHDSGEQTFHIEMEIQGYHKQSNYQLRWISYNIFTRYRNGQEVKTCLKESSLVFDGRMIEEKYPLLKFSRVKSYTQESEAPLQ